MSKLKKTLLLGGLVSAGLVWLTSSKKGKEVRDQILDHAENIYEKMEKKLSASGLVGKVSKSAFMKRAKELVDEYSEQKKIPSAVKAIILQTVLSQWETFQRRVEMPAKAQIKKGLRSVKSKIKKASV